MDKLFLDQEGLLKLIEAIKTTTIDATKLVNAVTTIIDQKAEGKTTDEIIESVKVILSGK